MNNMHQLPKICHGKLPDMKGAANRENRVWMEKLSIIDSFLCIHPLHLGSCIWSENWNGTNNDFSKAWDYGYNGNIIFDRVRTEPRFMDEIILRIHTPVTGESEAKKIIATPPDYLHFKTYNQDTGELLGYRYYDGKKVSNWLKSQEADRNDNWYNNYKDTRDFKVFCHANDDGTTFAAWDARLTPELLVYSAG
jgi:hypothetical protein